jgi:hypothetical protein
MAAAMEFRHLIRHFTYRIEEKPGGGFIAHASDPTLSPLEAPTRQELQQKIQERISAAMGAEFPGLKLLDDKKSHFAFHIEANPGGSFSFQSADPDARTIEASTPEEIEPHFKNKLIRLVGQEVLPELSQALAKPGGADVDVSLNTKSGFVLQAGSHRLSFGSGRNLSAGDPITEAPITPEGSGWSFFHVFLVLVIVAALLYYVLHR